MPATVEKVNPDKQEALDWLRANLKAGDTVYTILRHVSASGMSRGIDLYIIRDNKPVWITSRAGKAMDRPQSRTDWEKGRGLRINGCGMDMGFALVNDLSIALFCPDGYTHEGAYALNHAWL